MTTVSLTTARLQDAEDLTVEVDLGLNTTAFSRGRPVEVKRRAGGRREVTTRAGTDVVYSVTAPSVTRATWEAVEDLVGKPVLFRDTRGHKVFGVIGGIAGSEFLGADVLESLSFTITRITWSESA